jgi:hypothetical protein
MKRTFHRLRHRAVFTQVYGIPWWHELKALRTANRKLTANDFHSFYHFERIHKTDILKSARPPPPGPTILPPNYYTSYSTYGDPNDVATAIAEPGDTLNAIPDGLLDPLFSDVDDTVLDELDSTHPGTSTVAQATPQDGTPPVPAQPDGTQKRKRGRPKSSKDKQACKKRQKLTHPG